MLGDRVQLHQGILKLCDAQSFCVSHRHVHIDVAAGNCYCFTNLHNCTYQITFVGAFLKYYNVGLYISESYAFMIVVYIHKFKYL